MPRHITAVAFACVAFVLFAGEALAAPITFSFAGSVTDDPFGLSSFGAPITGAYTFDSTATDTIPSPSTGSFPSVGPAFGFTTNVDGTAYSLSSNLTVNTANNIGVDQYGAIATSAVLTLEVFLQDSTQTALSSDALPLLPPTLAAFDFRQFRLFSDDAEFLGTIDSLTCTAGCGTAGGGRVPEPAMLWLITAALTGLTLRRKQTAR
jgi:hypothetical protein